MIRNAQIEESDADVRQHEVSEADQVGDVGVDEDERNRSALGVTQ